MSLLVSDRYSDLLTSLSKLDIYDGEEFPISITYNLCLELLLKVNYTLTTRGLPYFSMTVVDKRSDEIQLEIFVRGEPPPTFNSRTIIRILSDLQKSPRSYTPYIPYLISTFNLRILKDRGDFIDYLSRDGNLRVSVQSIFVYP